MKNIDLLINDIDFHRNLSPVVDRKLLIELQNSGSFKASSKGKKSSGKPHLAAKSPKNYLSGNLSSSKKNNHKSLFMEI